MTHAAVQQLFNSLNLRLFFNFGKEQLTKRNVNIVAGGMITFGNTEPPVPIYGGPTDAKSVKAALESGENLGISSFSDEEVNSSRNVSRGNKTSFELFLGPFSGWKQVHWDMAVACNL